MSEVAVAWKPQKWVAPLEPLRGIAAFTVCLAHLHFALENLSGCPSVIGLDDPKQGLCAVTFPIIWNFGAWGVGLFFVLSGFCIHLPQAKRAVAGAPMQLPDVRAFLKQRLRRLAPAYWVCLIAATAVAYGYAESELVHKPNVVDFVSHFFFMHGWAGYLHSLNAPLWSIGIEMHFYFAYPLLLIAYRKWKAGPVTIALFFIGMALYYVFAKWGPSSFRRELVWLFPVVWWRWSLGAWLAEIYVSPTPPVWAVRLLRFPFSEVVWGVATYAVSYLHMRVFRLDPKEYLIYPFLVLFLGAVITRDWTKGPIFKALSALGDQSYSLYLFHPIAYAVLFPILRQRNAGPWTWLVVCLSTSLLISRLVFELIERRTLKPRTPAPAVPAASPEPTA